MSNENNWGGKREGAGRPLGWRKGSSDQRKQHQVRAYDDEWELVRRFNKIVRTNKAECQKFLDEIEKQ